MINRTEREKSNLVNEDGFFKKVLENRYKDTPYSIVKETIGKDWMIYFVESENIVYGIERTDTKKRAIEKIEGKELYNEIYHQSSWYNNIMLNLSIYMKKKDESKDTSN